MLGGVVGWHCCDIDGVCRRNRFEIGEEAKGLSVSVWTRVILLGLWVSRGKVIHDRSFRFRGHSCVRDACLSSVIVEPMWRCLKQPTHLAAETSPIVSLTGQQKPPNEAVVARNTMSEIS